MVLSNFTGHPDAVDMGTTKQRHRRSNARDNLLSESENNPININVTAGGTIVLTVEQRLSNALIRLTGTPGAGFTIEVADGNRRLVFENVSGQTATIDTTTGATPTEAIPTGETRIIFINGIEVRVTGSISLEVGALMHSGQVNNAANQNWADFQLASPEFKDYSSEVTSPSSSSGTLVLDMENGNVFDVTLTEAITTLTLSNPPATDKAGTIIFIARQDATAGWAITWPASIIWERDTGDSPGQTVTTSAVDIYILTTFDAGTTWYGFVIGLDMG